MDLDAWQRLFGMLSYLLLYPDDEWREGLPVIRDAAESVPNAAARRALAAFLDEAEAANEREWQDRYVRTFDFGKKSNLYLTYGEHGEDRERGTALLELKRRYAEAGFVLAGSELPDYLPLMLEFASVAPWEAAGRVLVGSADALASIHRELAASGCPYEGLFGLILRLVPEAGVDFAADTPQWGRGTP